MVVQLPHQVMESKNMLQMKKQMLRLMRNTISQ
nr:MAG TPA: hypothetical protein [Caudoviricetes sp.]